LAQTEARNCSLGGEPIGARFGREVTDVWRSPEQYVLGDRQLGGRLGVLRHECDLPCQLASSAGKYGLTLDEHMTGKGEQPSERS
jgi:hypothetical protein